MTKETTKSKLSLFSFTVEDEDIDKAIKYAAVAYLVMAGIGLIVTLNTKNYEGLVDVGLMVSAGILIWFLKSRVAAVAGLGYYIISQIILLTELGRFSGGIFIRFAIVMLLIRGAVGAFKYQESKQSHNTKTH